MELELAGRRALVTGGSSGVGLACAHGLAAEGVDLAIAAPAVDPLKEATRVLRDAYDVTVTSHSCDLSRTDHQRALAEVVGSVDILINNTGDIGPGGLAAVDDDEWRRRWDRKVFASINLCRLLLPPMLERGFGVVVNIIGTAAERPRPAELVAASGTAALVTFTRTLGAETALRGVRVVGVNPGMTVTEEMEDELREKARASGLEPKRWRELLPREPRPVEPDQVADVIIFLASARASMVSGTVLTVDGGASGR